MLYTPLYSIRRVMISSRMQESEVLAQPSTKVEGRTSCRWLPAEVTLDNLTFINILFQNCTHQASHRRLVWQSFHPIYLALQILVQSFQDIFRVDPFPVFLREDNVRQDIIFYFNQNLVALSQQSCIGSYMLRSCLWTTFELDRAIIVCITPATMALSPYRRGIQIPLERIRLCC